VRHGVDVEGGGQVVRGGDVEEGVDVVLAEDAADVGDRVVLEPLRLGRVTPDDDDAVEGARPGERQPLLERVASGGVADLGQPLGRRADEQLPPRLRVVEEVEVLEGEGEPEVGGDGLRVDPQSPQPAVLEPGDRLAVGLGRPVDGAEDVVDLVGRARGRGPGRSRRA